MNEVIVSFLYDASIMLTMHSDAVKILSAVRVVLESSLKCGKECCPLLDVFDEVCESIKERSDAEALRDLGIDMIIRKRCGIITTSRLQ